MLQFDSKLSIRCLRLRKNWKKERSCEIGRGLMQGGCRIFLGSACVFRLVSCWVLFGITPSEILHSGTQWWEGFQPQNLGGKFGEGEGWWWQVQIFRCGDAFTLGRHVFWALTAGIFVICSELRYKEALEEVLLCSLPNSLELYL